jgi:type I restriction enzyme R subunit
MGVIPFHPFQPEAGTTVKTHSKLPHWSQPGSAHFVTFRLADSMPKHIIEKWSRDRRDWLARRGVNPDTKGWFNFLSNDDKRDYRRTFGQAFENFSTKAMARPRSKRAGMPRSSPIQ